MRTAFRAVAQWFRDAWNLPWRMKGPLLGALSVLIVLFTASGLILATGGGSATEVSDVVQAPSPTHSPTANPTPQPTPTATPQPSPSPTVTQSAAPPAPLPLSPVQQALPLEPAPTPKPTPTPTPKPTPTPDPLGRIPPAYWIDARGDVVIYVYYPDLTCQEDFRVGQISCRSATRGWTLNCSSAGTRWSCSHSIDGSVSCLWDRNPPYDTSCIGAVWDGSCGNAYVQNIPTTTCRRTDAAGSESVVCSWSGLTATCEWQGHLTFRCVRATSSWSCSRLQ